MLVRTWLVPFLALGGIAFAGWSVANGAQPIPAAPPATEPARAPFARFVAGAGLVEAASENVAVATPLGGVVVEVHARVGVQVAAGAPLLRLDDRSQRAELAARRAQLARSRAERARLAASPRVEDLPPAEARLAEAQANAADAAQQLALYDSVQDKRAVSADELNRRRFAAQAAQARVRAAEADLARLAAGAWAADLAVADAQVAEAQAAVDAAEVEIARLVVAAPIAGEILQVGIRAGEYAAPGVGQPLVLMGATSPLHVRVDIDEHEAWRLAPGARASASLRGNPAISVPLAFVRREPYVVPKRSLTGDSTERVDTRVLQVVYSFARGDLPISVGQQMDVFIEDAGAAPSSSAPAPIQAAP